MSRLAESLAQSGAEVEVLSLNPRKHRGVPAGPLPVRAIDIDTSRFVFPTPRMPWLVRRFVSREFAAALREVAARFQPDVVQIESPFLLPYAREVRDARLVLRSLNVEFRIWEGLAHTERNPLRRMVSRRIAASLRRYELREMSRVDAVVPISAEDAADFRALGCTLPMHVVPCGVTLPALGGPAPQPGRVGFIGSLDFRPNQQAVSWILDELWPRVRERAPEARLAIAGSSPPEWLRRRNDLELHANVDDAQAFVRGLSVFIAPLFTGGGMRIKVVEAMALARPVVATAIGAGGIAVEHEHDLLLAEDASSFAEAIVRLLRDPALAARIGAAARDTVATCYDSAALARGLLSFYASL